jgi:hypothetical protein
LDIDFVNGKIKNNLFKNIQIDKYEILHYLNAYMNMLIYKFFKYFLKGNSENAKLEIVLQKIKMFPRLYEVLHLLSKDKDKIINLSAFIDFVNEINCDDIINFQKADVDMEKYIKVISIINTINFILLLMKNTKILIKFKFSENIDENSKIFDILVKNKAKIIDLFNIIKEDFYKNNKSDMFSSFINAIMLDKKEIIPIKYSIEFPNKYFPNDCFIKREYLKQNDKNIMEPLYIKNNITFHPYMFIERLKEANKLLFESIF